jgi:hypothetical protein
VKFFILAIALLTGGCEAAFRIPADGRAARPTEIIEPGVKVINSPTGQVIAPAFDPSDWCYPRARYFKGIVPQRCEDIARQARP